MKYEWKKQEKNLYGAKLQPSLLNVPKQNFIQISGKGNPNDIDFSNRVSVLYSLAYAIKMAYKADNSNSILSKNITDFMVYPLEGIWQKVDTELVKENLSYTIMIRQPDFVTKSMFDIALEKVEKKKPNSLLSEISFTSTQESMYIEILHIGSYDDEPESFQKMNQFALENGLKRSNEWHREIYLNNANRVEKSKLKTILRYTVTNKTVK